MNQKKSLECLFVQNCYSLLLLIVRIIYTASHNNSRETFSAPCAKNRVYSLRRIYLRDKSFYRQSSKLDQTSLECLHQIKTGLAVMPILDIFDSNVSF